MQNNGGCEDTPKRTLHNITTGRQYCFLPLRSMGFLRLWFPSMNFQTLFVVEHILTLVTLKSVITGKNIVWQNTYEVGIFRFFVYWLALIFTETVLLCVSTFSVVLPSSSWQQWSPDFFSSSSFVFFLLATVVSWYDKEAISHKSHFKHIWGDICRVLEP